MVYILREDGLDPDDIALAFNKTPRSIYSWLAMMQNPNDDAINLYQSIRELA
jgi:hypothetical protein